MLMKLLLHILTHLLEAATQGLLRGESDIDFVSTGRGQHLGSISIT